MHNAFFRKCFYLLHRKEVSITKLQSDLLCTWMDFNRIFCDVCTLGVSPSLVSRYCEGYSFWSIWGPYVLNFRRLGPKLKLSWVFPVGCLSLAEKEKQGKSGLTLENIEKTLIHFAPSIPENHWIVWKSYLLPWKPLKCSGKPPPRPFPCYGDRGNKGTPSFNVPFRPQSMNQ